MANDLPPGLDPGHPGPAPAAGADGRPQPVPGGIESGTGVLIDVAEWRKLIRQLEDRLRFETVLSGLSARFINLPPDQVDQEIEAGLRLVGEYLGIDRSTLFQLADNGTGLVVTHCWAIPGFEVPKGLIARELLPWSLAKVLCKEIQVFASLDELPPEAAADKKTLRQFGQKSSVGIPLSAGGSEVFGAIGFGTVTAERSWSEDLIQRLQLIAQIYANTLIRKWADQKLQQALREIKALQDRLQQENVYLRQEAQLLHNHEQVIGQSRAVKAVLAQVEQVAGTDTAVLLLGETGTGKEVLATAIHNLSPRRSRVMVKVNCAALPAALIESELFGREKGAYTGALAKQVGRFELAHRSTIFLDEVGDLAPEVQVKLLRVLQEGTLEHLGSPRSIQVDVRVIAATNRDLAGAVRDGRFREDLFYRLNVFPITVPPLRERREDIPLLVWAFVEELGKKMGRTVRAITRESMEALQAYGWPGNVRELRNLVERAMITSTGPTLHIVLPEVAAAAGAQSLALEDVERAHILHVLELTHWRVRGQSGAADLLRVKPTTLESRMARLGIRRPGKTSGLS